MLFYELSPEKDQKITWPQPAFIIDLTDNEFLVSSVTSADAYHANKKDVTSIFKISVLKLFSPKQFQHTLVLTNNESEKIQYVNMLSDLSSKVKSLKENGANVSIEIKREKVEMNSFTFSVVRISSLRNCSIHRNVRI